MAFHILKRMIVGKPETGRKLLVLKSNVTNGVPGFEKLVKEKIPSPLNFVSCLNLYEFGYFERFFSTVDLDSQSKE